jgi:hypothetical protein
MSTSVMKEYEKENFMNEFDELKKKFTKEVNELKEKVIKEIEKSSSEKVELVEIDSNDFKEYGELCENGTLDDYLYSELKKVFGKCPKKTGFVPGQGDVDSDDEPDNWEFEWTMKMGKAEFSIYDDGHREDDKKNRAWHLSGTDKKQIKPFMKWLDSNIKSTR